VSSSRRRSCTFLRQRLLWRPRWENWSFLESCEACRTLCKIF
jgi:hypothetical protein